MAESSLRAIRAQIELLASEEGSYYLVCARCGDRPVPAATLRFESRTIARAAAGATEQYRMILREYDPDLPRYEIVVCQAGHEEETRLLDARATAHSEA